MPRPVALEAQARSVTVLKNSVVDGTPVLPVAQGRRVYAEGIDPEVLAKTFKPAVTPQEAHLAIVRIDAPFEPRDDLFLEAYFHQGSLELPPGLVHRLRRIAQDVPLIVNVALDRRAILTPLLDALAGLTVTFGVSDDALLAALTGRVAPRGRLPVELPRSMQAVRESAPTHRRAPRTRCSLGSGLDIKLLGRMTMRERSPNSPQSYRRCSSTPRAIRPEVAAAKLANGIGYVEPHMGGFPANAAALARLNNEVQRHLVQNTRLGIPAIMHIEALNGVNAPTFTSFPTAIPLAATWDTAGIGEMAALTRRQTLSGALRAALPGADVIVAEGCGITDGAENIAAAVEAARDADIVVLALGGLARSFFTKRTEGEGADAADVGLPEVQRRLAHEIAALGRTTVGVIFSGRPVVLGDVEPELDAILLGYYGSQFGTRAVADVLTGAAEPQGRLPYTIPRSSGQVPIHVVQRFGSGYRRREGDPHGGYVDETALPLYPFGHGLTYTRFTYSDLTLSSASVAPDGTVDVTVTVKNTGDRSGVELVQLYVEEDAPGISRPALQLAGFHRLELHPGEEATVTFALDIRLLAHVSLNSRWVVDPGPMWISAGPSSSALPLRSRLDVVGDTADVTGRRVYLTHSTTASRRAAGT
ncbi:glycoside hydrolase family 3 C-terminal domain-containing protein [Streptomyces sp. bgisy027]|uniref:glycoside hydrolase family 3 C-terminal domain-containing protein n=1 Tax=unclassified Streptomyces TaxID=2593676 RepID=UPI003D727672